MSTLLQLVIALGLLNVWFLRAGSSTRYRGGDANSLREEFAVYGLPTWAFYAVGGVKVGAAIGLVVGLWVPALVVPCATILIVAMIGALVMHVKVSDPADRSLPAFSVLSMCVLLVGLAA